MLYTSLYSFPLSHPDFLVTPSHSLKPLVSDSRFSSQPQFSFIYLFFNVESHPVAAMLTASLAFSPVSFTSLTFSHRLPKPHPGLYHYLTVLHLWNLNFKVPPCVQIVTLPALSLIFQGLQFYHLNCQESVLFSLSHCHHLSSSHHYPLHGLPSNIHTNFSDPDPSRLTF